MNLKEILIKLNNNNLSLNDYILIKKQFNKDYNFITWIKYIDILDQSENRNILVKITHKINKLNRIFKYSKNYNIT